MVIFRFIALVFLAVALMIMGADIVETLENDGQLAMRSIGDLWGLFHASSYEGFTESAPGGAILVTIMKAPGTAVFGALGLILAFLFRRRDM